MYEWVVDGLSSLFEPITGQKHSGWPGLNVGGEIDSQRQDSNARPTKRNYQRSVTGLVLAHYLVFVKKTVAGVAGLLRLRNPLSPASEEHRRYTRCVLGLVFSGLVLGPGNPDRGRDGDKPQRCSLQLLPSRPTQGVGVGTGPPSSDLPTPNRFHRQCLAVEEALKESDKEHYRRLLEIVSDKYSKSQPLPFTRTKPQGKGARKSHKAAMKHHKVDIKSLSLQQKQPELDLSAEVAARLNLVDRETPTHTDTLNSTEELPRFSKEMAVEVSRALSQRDPNLVLSSAFKLCITQRDLASLQEGSWLNDEVINFYLSLVMTRSSSAGQGLKVYSFSTFFFPKLHGGGHAAVKRWTKAVDLFQYDIILVPLHLGVHWSLAVINFNSRTVRSYDSMGQRHDDICSLLLLYLREEHKARKDQDLDECKWTVGSLRASEIPQQKNGSDCGVFACKYADYVAQGWPLTFRQCHMPLFRKLMIWEILNQRLL
uniref:SUMO specific peptidase 2 n=1 Tax=Salmo trutta TaxID=8032 RepID=A0A674DNL8_SALTR